MQAERLFIEIQVKEQEKIQADLDFSSFLFFFSASKTTQEIAEILLQTKILKA